MKLIKDWKECPKFWSIQAAVACAVFSALEVVLPLWQPMMPRGLFASIATFLAVAVPVLRVLKQEGLLDDE